MDNRDILKVEPTICYNKINSDSTIAQNNAAPVLSPKRKPMS